MTKKKYIDSHWLVFMFQGAVALAFGCITLFTSSEQVKSLMPFVGTAMLGLAVVEFINAMVRSYSKQGWIVALLVAMFDAAFGVTLVVLLGQEPVVQMIMLAAYTLIRGGFELLLGFKTTVDPTDRFIWVLTGLCGVVFGFVILNSGRLATVEFVRFFGAYLLIFGVSSLIYGAHNHTQQKEAALPKGKKSSK